MECSAPICFSHKQRFAYASVLRERRIQPNMYFVALSSILGADLPWISELFCGKRRGKCIAYSTEPPLFGLQTGVGDFTLKSPKDAVKRW